MNSKPYILGLALAAAAFSSQAADDGSDLPLILQSPFGGQEVTYDRTSKGTTRTFYSIVEWTDDNLACKVVTFDDGTVYLQNPVSTYVSNTYIKGTIEDGKMKFELPQRVDYDTSNDRHYILYRTYQKETTNSDGQPARTQAIDPDNQTVTFTINEDGTITKDEPECGMSLMFYNESQFRYSFSGFSDWEISMKPLRDKTCPEPAGVTPELYALEYVTTNAITDQEEYAGHHVWLASQGNKVWMKGVYEKLPDTWVEGTLSGNDLKFEGYQYLGVDEWYSRLTYLCGGVTEVVHDADLGDYYVTTLDDYVTLSKKDDGIYHSTNSMVINGSNQRLNEILTLPEYTLRPVNLDNLKACPEEPIILENEGYNNQYGFGYVLFELPRYNVKGELMDVNRCHYTIYFDDEPFTAEPADYPFMEEEITDIPYTFSNGDLAYASGSIHYFFYPFTGFDKIGIKYTYTDYDGQQYSSAWNVAGVKSLGGEKPQVANECYYDLNGCPVANPEQGIVIRKVTYSNGAVEYHKEIKR